MFCLFAILVALSPRVAVACLWIFTPYVTRAFYPNTILLPLLGILFLPVTTLMYVLVWIWTSPYGVTGFAWFWVALGLLIDIGSYAGGGYSNRGRLRGTPASY